MTDSTEFSQNVESLTFFDGSSNKSGRQCYNLTVIGDLHCEYCNNRAYLLSQLTTNSTFVKFNNSEVRIYIEEDFMQCGMLVFYFETIFTAFYILLDNTKCALPEQNIDIFATASLVIFAVVIVILAVTSVIIVYFCSKKKKVKASDMTL